MGAMIRAALVLLAVGLLTAAPSGARTAVAVAPGCEVESATLSWGFKESFRAYIDGSIANGEWTVADGAAYETPLFGFTAEAGRLDPGTPYGSVSFSGSIRFTGHGGILDTTVANPTLRFDGSTAVLALDVDGPTMEGDPVSVAQAPFVDVDLTGQDLTAVDGVVTIVDAPTTLREEGAAAFPNYAAGEAFDPLSATFDVGDCELAGGPVGGDAAGAVWMPWAVLGGSLVVAAVLVAAVVVLTRRRS